MERHELAPLVRPKNTSLTAWSPVVACFKETCGETNHEPFPMLKASWRKTNISKHVHIYTYIEHQTIVCTYCVYTCLANLKQMEPQHLTTLNQQRYSVHCSYPCVPIISSPYGNSSTLQHQRFVWFVILSIVVSRLKSQRDQTS